MSEGFGGGIGFDGDSGSTATTYYIDANNGAIVTETLNTMSGTIGINTNIEYALSAISTPSGGTLAAASSITDTQIQYFYSPDGKWHNPGRIFFDSSSVIGSEANVYNGDTLAIQTGASGIWAARNFYGGTNLAIVGFNTVKNIRVRISVTEG